MQTWSRRRALGLVGVLGLVLLANLFLFVRGGALQHESIPRSVIGSVFIFLLPGLVWGDVLGFRARHPLHTVAVAFILTLILEIAALTVCLSVRSTIKLWLDLLFAVSGVGLGVLAYQVHHGRPLRFLRGFTYWPRGSVGDRVLYVLTLLIPVALAVMCYRWGEALLDVGYEKLIHIGFIRLYYQVPLVLADLGLDRNLTPPNLIHLWEFLLAGWARVVGMDPLPLFARCRFVLPILSLSGMYLLVKAVLQKPRLTSGVFFVVLLLCLCEMILTSPFLAWVKSCDPSRGVFAFMPSAHHADSAMDVLLPLSAAVLLMFIRQTSFRNGVLLAGVLTASFLWHPREFLQLALALGVLGPTILLFPHLRKRAVLKGWVLATAVLVGSAVGFLVLSSHLVPPESHAYDEMGLKKKAVDYAFKGQNLRGVRSPFNFPLHFVLSSTMAPDKLLRSDFLATYLKSQWHYDAWLVLCALGVVFLAVLGAPQEKVLAVHTALLWFFALCWNSSMYLILALTYSEFFISTPRLLYISFYVVVGTALVRMQGVLQHGGQRMLATCVASPRRRSLGGCLLTLLVMFEAGRAYWKWDHSGQMGLAVAALDRTDLLVLALVVVVLIRNRSRLSSRGPTLALSGLASLLFFLPFLGENYRVVKAQGRFKATHETHWFAKDNPFGHSRELIALVRWLPAKQKLLTNATHKLLSDPTRPDYLPVYAPHYYAICGVGSIIKDLADLEAIREGRHAVFRLADRPTSATISTDEQVAAREWLRSREVNYVILDRQLYETALCAYFRTHPEDYSIIFDNPAYGELVVALRPDPTRH